MPVQLVMHFRMSTIFNATSAQTRTAGWKEKFMVNAASIDAAKSIVNAGKAGGGRVGLLHLRGQLLPETAIMSKYTLQLFDARPGVGEYAIGARVTDRDFFRKGVPGVKTDFPQQAVLLSMFLSGGHPQTIRFPLRCVPDDNVRNGEWQPIPSYAEAVALYLRELEEAYGSYVDDRITDDGKGRKIESISADGLVTYFGGPMSVAQNDVVKITKTTNSDGKQKGGLSGVAGVEPDENIVAVYDWERGETTGGTVRKWTRLYATFAKNTGKPVKQMTRKVGSPKDYRGTNRRRR